MIGDYSVISIQKFVLYLAQAALLPLSISHHLLMTFQICESDISQTWFTLSTTVSLRVSRLRQAKRRTSGRIPYVKYRCSKATNSCSVFLATLSSGCSSPPYTSLSHSRASSSTQSPVTSQASVSDLASSGSLAFARPQPRIQVSSLLSESNTR